MSYTLCQPFAGNREANQCVCVYVVCLMVIDSAKATREISQVGMVEGQTEDKT